MGEGFTEPVVTKLEGDISNLEKKLTEALALVKGFGTKTETEMGGSGEKAGKAGGEKLMAAYQKAIEDVKPSLRKNFGTWLDDMIKENERNVRNLAQELRKTGDIDIWKNLKNAEKGLGELKTLGKEMAKQISTGLEEGEKGFGAALQGMLSNAVTGAPVIAGLVGLGVVLAPAIGGALGGAVLTALAAVPIGVAIAGQLHDPAVQGAFNNLKTQAKETATQASQSMAPVFADAMNRAGVLLERMEPSFEKAFDRLAPHVDNLFQGITGLVEKMWPGFIDALEAAGPVLDMLGVVLPQLGHQIGVMFRAIADGAPGARDAFGELLLVLGGTLEVVGYIIEGLSKAFTIMEAAGAALKGHWGEAVSKLGELKENTHGAADATNGLAGATGKYGKAAADAATATDDLFKGLEKIMGLHMSAEEAAIKDKDAVKNLTDSITQNGRAWDINTEAGRKNEQALLDAIKAADQKRQADVANGKDATQAASDYNTEVEALLKIAGRAGDAKGALDNLRGEYEIDINEVHKTQWLNEGIPPSQYWHGAAKGGFFGPNGPDVLKAAAGLMSPRSPGTLVLAGEPETGGEYLIPRRGITQQRAASLISAAAADHGLGMGGGGVALTLRIPLYLNGRQVAEASYEDFVNAGQERAARRGSTGF